MKFYINLSSKVKRQYTEASNIDKALKKVSKVLKTEGDKAEVWAAEGNLIHTLEKKQESSHSLIGVGFYQNHYPKEMATFL